MKTQVFRDVKPRKLVKCTDVKEDHAVRWEKCTNSVNHAASIVRARTDDGASRSLSKLILLPDYTASHSSRPQYLVTSNALGCQCAMYYKTPTWFPQNYEGICIRRVLIWISLSRSLATHNKMKQRQSYSTFKNKGKLEICVTRHAK